MADKIIVYGNDIHECIKEAQKECSRKWWKTADEITDIDEIMNDESYKELKELDFFRMKAKERYKDLMFDRLVADVAITILDIVERVPVPNVIDTEKSYKEYKDFIYRRIAKEILKEVNLEE